MDLRRGCSRFLRARRCRVRSRSAVLLAVCIVSLVGSAGGSRKDGAMIVYGGLLQRGVDRAVGVVVGSPMSDERSRDVIRFVSGGAR
jgi:hypothetical protein